MKHKQKFFKFIPILGISLCLLTSCVDMEWLSSIGLPFQDGFCNDYFWEEIPDLGFDLPLPEIPVVPPSSEESTKPILPTTSQTPSISSSEIPYEYYYYNSNEDFFFINDEISYINSHFENILSFTNSLLDKSKFNTYALTLNDLVSNVDDPNANNYLGDSIIEVDYNSTYSHFNYKNLEDYSDYYVYNSSNNKYGQNTYYIVIDECIGGNKSKIYDAKKVDESFEELLTDCGLYSLYEPYAYLYSEVFDLVENILEDLQDHDKYKCLDALFIYYDNTIEFSINYSDVNLPNVNLYLNAKIIDGYINNATYQEYIFSEQGLNGSIIKHNYSSMFNPTINKFYPSTLGYTKGIIFG